MKILVFGSNGQLGKSLVNVFYESDDDIFFFTKKDMDISDSIAMKENIDLISPDIVINTAAYTLVDEAESKTKDAFNINEIAVKNLATICKKENIYLVHISTDYVFDGNKIGPYTESDHKNPQSIYGLSKSNGEDVIIDSGCRFIIIRTSWVFSEYGKNFLKTMLMLSEKKELSIVSDQFGCPTYAVDLAIAIKKIILSNEKINGIFHFAGDKETTWFHFCKYILDEAFKLDLVDKIPLINPIKTENYPTPARRPKNSVLDSSSLTSLINFKPSDWRLGVKMSLLSIKNNKNI